MAKQEFSLAGMAAIFNTDKVILALIEELREWVDNRPSDKLLGYRYTVVSPAKDWTAVQVRVDGPTGLPITPEDLHKANESVKPIFVRFEGINGKIWQDKEKNLRVTCTASSVQLIRKAENTNG